MRPEKLNYLLSSISSLKGVGPKLEQIINKLKQLNDIDIRHLDVIDKILIPKNCLFIKEIKVKSVLFNINIL